MTDPSGRGRDAVLRWSALVGTSVVLTVLLELAGVGSAALLAALLCGLGLALTGRAPTAVPARWGTVAQALVGASIGATVTPEAVGTAARSWPELTVVCLLTLVLSILGGLLLARRPGISRVTAVLSLTAGGAAGLTAMSRELGADDRVVSVLQYLRVLLISAVTPLVAMGLMTAAGGTRVSTVGTAPAGLTWGHGVLLAFVVVGPWLGRLARVPAGSLLAPLVLVAVAGALGVPLGDGVPHVVLAGAFLVIGWQAGVRFTVDALRVVARLLPTAVALNVALVAACAALGAALAAVTGASQLDAYLATTPGGIYVALAVALGIAGTDTAFVVTSQVLRTIVMLAVSPLLARALARGAGGAGAGSLPV